MINKIQFYITSNCQLRCEFCPRSIKSFKSPKILSSLDDFKRYADICINYGITEFELSPLVGEALFDDHIFERIEYLNAQGPVRKIFFFTNMLLFTPSILEESKEFEKFSFKLSLYGSNREQYKQRTGVDAFGKMMDSLFLVLKHKPRVSEIDIRYLTSRDIKQDDKYFVISKALFAYYKNVVHAEEDVNWKDELVTVTTTLEDPPIDRSHELRAGTHCPFIEMDLGIWPDGDLGICSCWFDINKKMIIGNLNTSDLSSILEKVETYKEEQEKGFYRSLCSVCTYPLRLGSVSP